MTTPASVDEYLAALEPDRRKVVEALRRTVKAAAPDAVELISYGMPALKSHGGHFLVSYAAFKSHYSLFPASDGVVNRLAPDITPYLAGRGTIQFPAKADIPLALVERVVKIRLAENAAAEQAKQGRRAGTRG